MIGAQPLVLTAQVGGLAQFERKAHGIERRPPLLAVGQRAAEHRQTVGFEIAVAGALIGDIGRGRGAIEQQRAFVVVARADLQHGARQPQPARCVGRRHGNELAEHRHAGAEIVLLEGGVGVAPQRRGRLGHRPGVALDLRFELDRRLVEIAALERFVGGQCRENGKGDERGGKTPSPARTDVNIGRPPRSATGHHVYEYAGATISSARDGVEVVAGAWTDYGGARQKRNGAWRQPASHRF